VARDGRPEGHAHAGSRRSRLIPRLIRSWRNRVAVAGHSMEPRLRDGDWLLVDPLAFVKQPPRVGELVVATDPRATERLLVKRVRSSGTEGDVTISGDHRAHADEAVAVALSAVVGRPWFRYAPLRRIGRIS
jgi:Signal peptidase, peptidase S26